MSRLITFRRVWLALAVGVLAAAVVAVVRLRRRPEDGLLAGLRVAEAPIGSSAGTDLTAAPAPRWPPVPILGVPTEKDLSRYAAGHPSAFWSAVEWTLGPRPPREPLDGGARSRLTRWGAAGIGLCLLAFGTQVLENAVFSPQTPAVEEAVSSTRYRCGQGTGHPIEEKPVSSYLAVWCTGEREGAEVTVPQDFVPPVTTTPPPDRPAAAVPDPYCRPKASAPRVRAVSPRVTRAVNHQWRRVERWLAVNAPKSLRTLDRPARARTIAVAEAQMGLRFPDDLRASLLRHDGARGVGDTLPFGLMGNGSHGVREIRDTWRRLCEADGEEATAWKGWWDGRMIPFGAGGSGDHLVIDSSVRDAGQTDHEGKTSRTPGGVRIRSYYSLLRGTANVLETGGSVGPWRPVVTDGELNWELVES